MNFEDSPCLGWLVFQRSAVTQLLGLAWGHPLPVSQGEEAPSGLDWGQSGLTAGSPATLGLPSTTVLSLTCHWTCSFSQGSPPLGHSRACYAECMHDGARALHTQPCSWEGPRDSTRQRPVSWSQACASRALLGRLGRACFLS